MYKHLQEKQNSSYIWRLSHIQCVQVDYSRERLIGGVLSLVIARQASGERVTGERHQICDDIMICPAATTKFIV